MTLTRCRITTGKESFFKKYRRQVGVRIRHPGKNLLKGAINPVAVACAYLTGVTGNKRGREQYAES
jgi:hypothetical protein